MVIKVVLTLLRTGALLALREMLWLFFVVASFLMSHTWWIKTPIYFISKVHNKRCLLFLSFIIARMRNWTIFKLPCSSLIIYNYSLWLLTASLSAIHNFFLTLRIFLFFLLIRPSLIFSFSFLLFNIYICFIKSLRSSHSRWKFTRLYLFLFSSFRSNFATYFRHPYLLVISLLHSPLLLFRNSFL